MYRIQNSIIINESSANIINDWFLYLITIKELTDIWQTVNYDRKKNYQWEHLSCTSSILQWYLMIVFQGDTDDITVIVKPWRRLFMLDFPLMPFKKKRHEPIHSPPSYH